MYHLEGKIIGRSAGKSAVAAAAYHSGQSLNSEYLGIEFDYSKKRDVTYSEIIIPDHAPQWMKERHLLWSAVEVNENRKDSTYARELIIALPRELVLSQKIEMVREYIKDNFTKEGMIADFSIHGNNSKNPHCHILLTMREIVDNQFGYKVRRWNDKKLFLSWREQWAEVINKYYALNGIEKRVSHLSFADRGIDLEPTIHRGLMDNHSNKEVLDRFQQSKDIKIRNYERLMANPNIAIDVLTNHESIFSHQELACFVHERTDSSEEFINLKIAIETCNEIVSLGEGSDGKHYYTSKQVLTNEAKLIEISTQLSKSKIHRLDPTKFKHVLATRTLNPEQVEAFNFILSGNDLSLIVGFAGTGKSYLMDAVREAYEATGYNVVGTALSGKAADGLRQEARIESKTIARFMLDWENGRAQLTNKTVLIIDEIGMVGTRQFLALINEANRVGAKIIGCGDPEQIPPVEAGCVFRFLLERLPHVFLKNIIRQNKDWQKEATIELSTRMHAKALDRYNKKGYVHAHPTIMEAMEAIIDRWHEYINCNTAKSAVMMSYRNMDVLSLNLMAREKLKAHNLLCKESKISTKAYGELIFAQNERIMFLRNETSLNVKNGLLGKILEIKDHYITVQMDRGDLISFDTREYKDIGYGYASTVHKMQGATIDQAFVLATPYFDRFVTNVAMDRHRDNVELHYSTEDFPTYDNLKRTLSRGESKVLATEFAQARGIDYNLNLDEAAKVESKQNFKTYYKDILKEAVPIKGTLAETYLKKLGIKDLNFKSLCFHPKIWEKETQCFMPALVAKAVGKGKNGLETKGVQITFLDNKGNKAQLKVPIRYNGLPNANKKNIDLVRKYISKDLIQENELF